MVKEKRKERSRAITSERGSQGQRHISQAIWVALGIKTGLGVTNRGKISDEPSPNGEKPAFSNAVRLSLYTVLTLLQLPKND